MKEAETLVVSLYGAELTLSGRDKDKIYEMLKEKEPKAQSLATWKEMAHAWVDGKQLEYWDLSPDAKTMSWQDSWQDQFFAYDSLVVYRVKEAVPSAYFGNDFF